MASHRRPRIEASRNGGRASEVYGQTHLVWENRLLRCLTNEFASTLLGAGREVTFPGGETLARQGTQVDSVLFLLEGAVGVEVRSPRLAGWTVALESLLPGDDIGLVSVLDNRPHFATMTAVESVVAVSAPLPAIRKALSNCFEWSFWRRVFGVSVTPDDRLRVLGAARRSVLSDVDSGEALTALEDLLAPARSGRRTAAEYLEEPTPISAGRRRHVRSA